MRENTIILEGRKFVRWPKSQDFTNGEDKVVFLDGDYENWKKANLVMVPIHGKAPGLTPLQTYEAELEPLMPNFLKAGPILAKIRDTKAYRETHGTFEDYCVARWKMSRIHGYRMIEAAETAEALLPIGSVESVSPHNEAQIRPLSQLPVSLRAHAWKKAVETNPKPTGRDVQRVVDTMRGKAQRKPVVCPECGHETPHA